MQYGPRIAAVIVYLYAGQFLSRQRTAQALAELFGVPLSSGTVAALTARAAGRPGGFPEHVRGQIAAAEVAGSGETVFRVQGRLHWVHCARTGKYTLLMVHPKRGTEAMKAMGVLGASQTAARSGPLMKKHHALARRLPGRQDDYLRFTTDFRAPPDNNERDIRMAKLRQKVSGCLRTLTGARQFCAIRSYLSSAAKHGTGFFDALVMLTKGEPWMPAST